MAGRIRRRRVRELLAVTSVVVAAIYLLIGVGAIRVVEAQGAEIVPPMLLAGAAYGLLAVLAVGTERRPVWIGGAALQALVMVGYLAVSQQRTPAFEPWGIALRPLQVLLLVGFVYLAVGERARSSLATSAAASRAGNGLSGPGS